MADLARLAIHQGSTPNVSLAEAVEAYSRGGIHAMTVRRERLTEHGVAEAAKHLSDAGMTVISLSGTGALTAEDPAERQRQVDHNRRVIDEASEVGASVAVFNCGALPEGCDNVAAARGRALDGLAELLPHARECGVTLGIEPLHPALLGQRSCLPTMALANEFCDQLGDGAGIVVDSFHVWWDPMLGEEIARAGKADRLASFHLSDWLGLSHNPLTDRGMMGDGLIDFRQIRGFMDDAGFDGPIEVEVFSRDNWWKRPVDEFVAVCRDRFQSEV